MKKIKSFQNIFLSSEKNIFLFIALGIIENFILFCIFKIVLSCQN